MQTPLKIGTEIWCARIKSFPRSWVVTGFFKSVTRWMTWAIMVFWVHLRFQWGLYCILFSFRLSVLLTIVYSFRFRSAILMIPLVSSMVSANWNWILKNGYLLSITTNMCAIYVEYMYLLCNTMFIHCQQIINICPFWPSLISPEWGKNRIVITTNAAYPLSLVTQIIRSV